MGLYRRKNENVSENIVFWGVVLGLGNRIEMSELGNVSDGID